MTGKVIGMAIILIMIAVGICGIIRGITKKENDTLKWSIGIICFALIAIIPLFLGG